uniref:Uncharacterized protein n=1 Tax=Arundo donax TaxID=35708 RepID=A0A0A9A5W4_ARUDO
MPARVNRGPGSWRPRARTLEKSQENDQPTEPTEKHTPRRRRAKNGEQENPVQKKLEFLQAFQREDSRSSEERRGRARASGLDLTSSDPGSRGGRDCSPLAEGEGQEGGDGTGGSFVW